MPEGGRISIEVREVELGKAYVERHQNVAPGKYVMLAVADTGIGMEPEVAWTRSGSRTSTQAISTCC